MADYKSKFTGAEIDDRLNKMLNVTWDELVALRNEGKLIPGQKYRMIDYETTCTWENTQVAGHPFDLVLTALDNKTLDEKCSAIQSERDTDGYFANSNLAAWDVRYCLDNDTERFDWAQMGGTKVTVEFNGIYPQGDSWGEIFTIDGVKYYSWLLKLDGDAILGLCEKEFPVVGDAMFLSIDGQKISGSAIVSNVQELSTGKGVIYRLTDEVDNSVPYDFKNIMFGRPLLDGKLDIENGVLAFCYTFSCVDKDSYAIEDESVKEPNSCQNNKFATGCQDNVFLSSTNLCHSNTFGDNCYSNTFGDNCYSNTFGDNCYSNTFGDNCYSNTFGNNCDSNTFGDNCYSNTFGDNCYSNTFGNYCQSNTFGDSCHSNTFGNNCDSNTFGDNCQSNTFGDSCDRNLFYHSCRYIVFVSEKTDNSYYYYSDIILEGDNNYITITNTQLDYVQRFIKYIKVCCGVSGSSSSPLIVDYTHLNEKQQMTVAFNSLGLIKVYCEADLVQ